MKNYGRLLYKAINSLLDLIYPPGLYCISCGKITDDSRTYRLCNDCMESVSWISDRRCAKCGRPLSENDPGPMCFGCSEREKSGNGHAFDRGHACASYGACAQSVIFAFKYGSRSDIGDTLGEILFDRMEAEYGPEALADMYDMVIPVPGFREKNLRRGFDHAELMAEGFAKRADICCEAGLLRRVRMTAPMKGLSPEERRANIRGAFSVRERKKPAVRGARILLIDDIFTTGATTDEAAAVLKESGACRVDFLAFAAAGDMSASWLS